MNWSGWDWRISLTEAGLDTGWLAAYKIPPPNKAPFMIGTFEMSQSEGGQAIHGYTTDDMLWNRLDDFQASRLKRFITDAIAGTGFLYFTVSRTDAHTPGNYWIDIRGRPHRALDLTDSGDIGERAPDGRPYYENFMLLLNNIEIVNDPSLYTVE